MWIKRQDYLNLKDKADKHNLLMDEAKSGFTKEREILQKRINDLEKKVADGAKELNKIKELVREQTSADILMVGLKAVGIIPEKTKKTVEDYSAEQNKLLQRYNAMAQSNYNYDSLYQNHYSNILGALGVGCLGGQRQL